MSDDGKLLDELGRKMLKRRVDALRSLPTFPESVLRIQAVLAGEAKDQSFVKVAAVIDTDPVLVARVLRLVNSAFFGTPGAVATVHEALVMVGLEVVRGIILSTHAMELLSARRGVPGLWSHCFGAAVAAGAIARRLGLAKVEEIATAALMHDLGKVVLATQLAADYAEVVSFAEAEHLRIREAEQALLGVTHDEIGQWLSVRWHLPPVLAQPIAHHHAPDAADKAHRLSTAVVHVADLLVRGFGFGFPGDRLMPDFDESAWRLLSLNGQKLELFARDFHRALTTAVSDLSAFAD